MKLSEKLLALASFLADENNELMMEAEQNDEALKAVATAMAIASDAINETAAYVAGIEPEESLFTPEKLDEMAEVARAFDESGDELLQKQAAVLDDILLTIGAPKGFGLAAKKADENRISELKKKYQNNIEKTHEQNKLADDLKTLKDSKVIEKAEIRDHAMSCRSCNDHPGVSLQRVGENEYQCPMDKRIYNYEIGYTTLSGKKVPGTSVANQSQIMNQQIRNEHAMFSTRDQAIGKE